jgi:hypothetical protein
MEMCIKMNKNLAKDFYTSHVSWEKVSANPGSDTMIKMYDRGFGLLDPIIFGNRMVIRGDDGISTSPVMGIKVVDNGLEITTENSLYMVKVIPN